MGKLPEDNSSTREGASRMEVEGSGYLLGETAVRKATIGVGKSIRFEKENEHINLGMITFREGPEQVRVKAGSSLRAFKVHFSYSLNRLVHRSAKMCFRPKMSQTH